MGKKFSISNKMYLRPEKVEPFIDQKVDENILAKIDDSDKKMLNYLGRLYKALGAETVDFNTVQSAIEGLQLLNTLI